MYIMDIWKHVDGFSCLKKQQALPTDPLQEAYSTTSFSLQLTQDSEPYCCYGFPSLPDVHVRITEHGVLKDHRPVSFSELLLWGKNHPALGGIMGQEITSLKALFLLLFSSIIIIIIIFFFSFLVGIIYTPFSYVIYEDVSISISMHEG